MALSKTLTPALAGSPPRSRNRSIDFLRGIALIAIFCDHLQPNFWNAFTPRGLGFSDFAEVFVFTSGYLNAVVFSKVLENGGFSTLFRRLRARMRILYSAHVVTLSLKFLIVYVALALGSSYRSSGLELAIHHPIESLAKAMLLLYMPADTSVLPLYLLFMALVPCVLFGLQRAPGVTLAVSCLLWMLSHVPAIHYRSLVGGAAWYFNPLSWQLLFVAGAALRIHPRLGQFPFLSRPVIVRIAGTALVAVAALKLASRFEPQLLFFAHRNFNVWLEDDFHKSTLHPLRLAHFACLLVVFGRWPMHGHQWLALPLPRLVAACGKHSLLIFCSTVVTGVLGNIAIASMSPSGPWFELCVLLLGASLMLAVAQIAEGRSGNGKPREPAGDAQRTKQSIPSGFFTTETPRKAKSDV